MCQAVQRNTSIWLSLSEYHPDFHSAWSQVHLRRWAGKSGQDKSHSCHLGRQGYKGENQPTISPPTYTKEQKHCFQVDLQWWRRTLHTDHSTTLELSGAGWCKCECSGDWNGGCGGEIESISTNRSNRQNNQNSKDFLNIFSIESSKICCSIALYMIENVIKKNTEGVQ